jgi:hypothetical protein
MSITESEKRHDAEADEYLHDTIKQLRKANDKLEHFIADAAAYIRHCRREYGNNSAVIVSTLYHDLSGLLMDEPCFLPKVTGYRNNERKE